MKLQKKLNRNLESYCVELINIDGIAFRPFINLLTLKESNSAYTYIRSAIITDDDRCNNKCEVDSYISKDIDYDYNDIPEISRKINNGKPSERCEKLEHIVSKINGMFISKAKKTLEYELAYYNPNIMLNVLKEVCPYLGVILEKIVKELSNNEEKATAIWLFISSRAQNKAEIAQKLIEKIMDSDFMVPEYIEQAIKFVTTG